MVGCVELCLQKGCALKGESSAVADVLQHDWYGMIGSVGLCLHKGCVFKGESSAVADV